MKMANNGIATSYYHQAALELGLPQEPTKYFDDDGRLKRTGSLECTHHNSGDWLWRALLGLGQLVSLDGLPVLPSCYSSRLLPTTLLLSWLTATALVIPSLANVTTLTWMLHKLISVCGYLQYLNIVGVAIGYTIAASISMVAIKRSNCFHKNGDDSPCQVDSNPYIIFFAIIEILLSDSRFRPDLVALHRRRCHVLHLLFHQPQSRHHPKNGGIRGSLTGISIGTMIEMEKVWRTLQAFGDIAFAYSYSILLIEIQRAHHHALLHALRMHGLRRLRRHGAGNLLTGFGFYNPYWLLDIANAAIVVHLVGAYQVYCQPLFAFVEKWAARSWPKSRFITAEIEIPMPGDRSPYKFNIFRTTWRSAFVVATTVVSMLLPFFNDVVGLLGDVGFWPLTVYFPVEMYIVQKKVERWNTRWVCLQMLSLACLAITVASAAGSIAGVVTDLKVHRPFKPS
ncbi:hypothetical protein ZIOFF_037530 [Zingiber officinale]|uniref:Amino acid transporter transmembrane domain-containing protein n=1 Tax=Zingiber officinale TaxID=94328 RepID=A0A8J5GDC9_ZINOF|nr:hypothetical protein ZIOFF_037530 [Zingiber officinale]